MAAEYKENGEDNVKLEFKEEKTEINFYRKPTEKELAKCRPVRICLIVLFALVLLGLLVGSIVLIAITEKCNKRTALMSNSASDISYHIHVKSFVDSDNDTVGDLQGVKSKLSYIESMGINTIILSGVVSELDFTLDQDVGSENDFNDLINAAKDKEMFIVIQFNPVIVSKNSDWFKNDSVKNDWFIWRNSTNDWLTNDGKNAWFKEKEQYYYSYYGEDLPMLNYGNDHVIATLKERLMTWMSYRIDGFLLQGVSRLTVNDKDNQNLESTHKILKDIFKSVETNDKVLWLIPDTSSSKTESYYGAADEREADIVISDVMATITKPMDATKLVTSLSSFISGTPVYGETAWLAGGPNFNRLASRFDKQQAAILNLLLIMLPGKVIAYYGDEIMLKDTNGISQSIMHFGDKTAFTNGSWIPENSDVENIAGFTNLTKIRHTLQKKLKTKSEFTSTGAAIRLDYGDEVTVLVNTGVNSVLLDPRDNALMEGTVLFSINSADVINVGSKMVLKSKFSLSSYQFTVVSK